MFCCSSLEPRRLEYTCAKFELEETLEVAPPNSDAPLPLLLDPTIDRYVITEQLAENGITIDWAYQPALHLQPVFRNLYGTFEGMLPRSEELLSRHICLPCHPRMSEEDAIYVSNTLRKILNDMVRAASKERLAG